MTGIEYAHIHAQEPILYVIRKQMRHSPTQGKMHCELVLWKSFMEECVYVLRNLKLRKLSAWCWTYFLQSDVLITPLKMILKVLDAFFYLLKKSCWSYSVNLFFSQCKFWFLPVSVTSLATYYILGGVVYQAPDIGSLINSRLVWVTVFHINFLANRDLIKARMWNKEYLVFCNEFQV